ncbi:MAG: SWIM zinc finger family protein [Clostridia bacterium]
MLVNEKIKEELYENAGDIRVQKARLYAKTGKVEIAKINYTNKDNFEITGKVTGQEIYRTNVTVESGEISDITCECQDYRQRYAACKHIIATIMEFDENQKYENMLLKDKSTLDINKKIRANAKYRSFTQIVNELYEEEMHEAEEKKAEESNGKIKIEPRLIYDKYYSLLKMDFKIGDKRMYKIKNLVEFFERMQKAEKFKYGNNLEFIHTKEAFAEEDQTILDFILKHAETINFVNSNSNSNYRYYGKALDETCISVSQTTLDEIFELFKNKEIDFKSDVGESTIKIIEEDPNCIFK